VGNIDYSASEQDLSKALYKIFTRIRVEKVTIPRMNGRSMYGFIEISWARKAPVKVSDLCIKNSSGMVKSMAGQFTSVNQAAMQIPNRISNSYNVLDQLQ
jgi:hypothetical protein